MPSTIVSVIRNSYASMIMPKVFLMVDRKWGVGEEGSGLYHRRGEWGRVE
jgi:hypothetical protein